MEIEIVEIIEIRNRNKRKQTLKKRIEIEIFDTPFLTYTHIT